MLKEVDRRCKDGEVIAASSMSRRALRDFYAKQIADAKAKGVLLSLHLKATMMKVSDPIMFGHAVEVFYEDVFAKHAAELAKLGVEPNNGIGDVYAKIQALPAAEHAAIEADIEAVYKTRPPLAMVDSNKGITNLHVPSDVIIDASMPAAIRTSGQMWGPDGKLHDTKAMIPDRCYAGIYQATIDDCKKNGAFDVRDDGQRRERRPDGADGRRVRLARQDLRDRRRRHRARASTPTARRCIEHAVEDGDIWRMCQTKDVADSRLGQARRQSRARHGPRRDLLARREARLRPQPHRQGRAAT